jgi:DUF971 family protein
VVVGKTRPIRATTERTFTYPPGVSAMSDARPTEIRYITETRTLVVSFDTGEHFEMSAEYLRVHSPSAEVRGHGPGQEVLQIGKEDVVIQAIEPVGNYAVRLVFDDGHNSGLYSFQELHRLGAGRDTLWQAYLDRLDAAGVQRSKSA